MSGHTANVEKWRHEQSLERTKQRRPDLFKKHPLGFTFSVVQNVS